MRPDVVLVSVYPPEGHRHGGSSGVASYTANLAQSLDAAGCRVAVVAPRERGERTETTDGRVRVIRCSDGGPAAFPAAARVAHALGAPVVHVQHEWFLWGGPASVPGVAAGLAWLRRRGHRVVVTLHQVVLPETVDRRFTRLHGLPAPSPVVGTTFAGLQRSIARFADRVIVHEPAFRRGVPRAQVVPHGVELGDDRPPAVARAQVGTDSRFTALCFGFVAPYKGLEAALGGIEAAGPEVTGVVAGGDHPRGEPGYATGLRRRYGHTARFTGYVPDEDVPPWFRAADVCLLLYPRPHASSGVLALALAHDLPVLLSTPLARAVGAPSELAVPPDPVHVARRLRALATDVDARTRLREATRRLGDGRSWPAVARTHLETYEEVARAHRPARRRLRTAQPRRRSPAVRLPEDTGRLDPGGDEPRPRGHAGASRV